MFEVMEPDKITRAATAIGFLAGVLACLDVIRDRRILWPPDVLWELLRPPQKWELTGGVALIAVTLFLSIVRHARNSS